VVVNPNRTFVTIHNLSDTNDIEYGFDPAALAAGTKRKTVKKTQAIDDESKATIYAQGVGADCSVETLEGQG
jgi:homospermidine synthase